MSAIAESVLAQPVIDGHCHPMSAEQGADERVLFEAPAAGESTHTLLESMIFPRAERLAGKDLLEEARVVGQVVDFGWPSDGLTMSEYSKRMSFPIKGVYRLEAIADDAVGSGERDVRGLGELVADRVEAVLGERDWVGLKSIAAYETGLDIGPIDWKSAQAELDAGLSRAAAPDLNRYLLIAGLRRLAEMEGVVQFHTGIGGRALGRDHEDPWALLPLLELSWMRSARVVLLHAGFPHITAAGRLTALFQNVYCDVSILMPFSFPSNEARMAELLAFAPPEKLLFGSDGCCKPIRYWAGVVVAKEALASLAQRAVDARWLTEREALQLVGGILEEHARSLYGM